jgi:hypothetical protein
MKTHAILAAAGLALVILSPIALPARADTVTLKNGSVIHGKILKIADGVITVATDFAGNLAIKQDKVASFETDDQVFVKTRENSTVLGKVTPRDSGLVVSNPSGNYQITVEDVKSSWDKSTEDPDRRHWNVEFTADVSGKSGNATGFAGAFGAVATLKSPTDSLKFYVSTDHSVANGQTSQDLYKGGVAYNAFFSPVFSWYVSSELMQDNVRDIALRVSNLAGIGYNLIHRPKHDLQFRAGFSYRYETYHTVPPTPDFSSAGGSFALEHRLDLAPWAVMKNTVSYMPAFKGTSNYIINHDSNFTLPLGGSKTWSMRFGIFNEYVSQPVDDTKRLDNTYYLRLVLDML